MPHFIPPRLALAVLLTSAPVSQALAHCYVGNRFFPATLNVDDPCVADELSLPTVSSFRNGDDPSARELDISGEFSKRITENFGISVETTWIRLHPPGGPSVSGFDNLGTSFKYQFLTDAAREFVMSASLDVDWGKTGSAKVDAEPFTTLTPTLFLGKGFGFLPEDLKFLRPLAVTAQVGYSIPTETSTRVIDEDSGLAVFTPNPRAVVWGGSLQYSMPYLKSAVMDLGLPDFANRLIPIVEWNIETQVANFDGEKRTTGTINPGLLYVADKYQLGIEAIVPINRASGDGVGVIAQFHLYLDDIFPTTIGQPLISTSTSHPMSGRQ
jgi:hypothetical protein